MSFLFFVLAVVAAIVAFNLWKKCDALESEVTSSCARHSSMSMHISDITQRLANEQKEVRRLQAEVESLTKYQCIPDAEATARSIIAAAESELEAAKKAAAEAKGTASQLCRAQIDAANFKLAQAHEEANRIIAAATKRAEEIAGDAYKAMRNAESLGQAAKAMRNLIEGYGDQYIVPSISLLDDIAEEYGFAEAGIELKKARERSRYMTKNRQAAECDYVEPNRKETAVRFVVDAFNGKVDSILSRAKADNYGTLKQAVIDAFGLVNHNGAAFRSARIKQEYLEARLEELRWANIAMELRERDREEQRRIKEQIKEEERARREFEKAIKEAEKEEEVLRRAMEKVQKDVERASEEQRAVYEAKLFELRERLREAEERGQRAISMAQQTKSGYVYVISNIGSFGDEVFKIGMTRRLEPTDRVRELGDASVPFEFDIHAMIYSEDAPALERTLHKNFVRSQVNKVNPRKEFFRVSLSDIRKQIDELGVTTHWTMTAAAKNYRESIAIEQAMTANPEIRHDWVRQQLAAVENFILEEENFEASAPGVFAQ